MRYVTQEQLLNLEKRIAELENMITPAYDKEEIEVKEADDQKEDV